MKNFPKALKGNARLWYVNAVGFDHQLEWDEIESEFMKQFDHSMPEVVALREINTIRIKPDENMRFYNQIIKKC